MVTAKLLQSVSRRMVPFYNKIAQCPSYSRKWARAVRQANLDRLEHLFHRAAPQTAKTVSLGVNGIGYFVQFPVKSSKYEYVNSTALKPGSAKFYFNPRVHSLLSRSVLPLYIELACNRSLSRKLANAIHTGNQTAARKIVRHFVTTRALRSIRLTNSGLSLKFMYPFSPYPVYNQLFADLIYKHK